MTQILPPTLARLWALSGVDPHSDDASWNTTFDPIGLILHSPLKNGGYGCTPVNTLSFASTGGDGVHYSLLTVNGKMSESSPVVMTVPMCDTPNVIVGADLREFLAFGCRFGYFSLEQLIYRPRETLQALASGEIDPDREDEEIELLDRISAAFDLRPWAAPERRLSELDDQFASMLILPERDSEA